ncbi:MAG: HDOD domain-containing protein [Desulfobacterales bacterium]
MTHDTRACLQKIKNKIKGLPLVDAAAFDALNLLNDPHSDYAKLAEKISPDVAARFLNIANSAFYGCEVRSLVHAMRLLGFSKMKQVLVTSFLLDHFAKHLKFKTFSFQDYLRQAQCCAAIARSLGEAVGFKPTEDLYTVALLHNIGLLVMAVYFGKAYEASIALAAEGGVSLIAAQTQVLGVAHPEIGALVLTRFNIPQEICEGVRYHRAADGDVGAAVDGELGLIARHAVRLCEKLRLPQDTELPALRTQLKTVVARERPGIQEKLRGLATKAQRMAALPELLGRLAEELETGLHKTAARAVG